jgi:hypothetical protein
LIIIRTYKMRNQKIFYPKLILFLIVVGIISFGFVEGDKKGKKQTRTYKVAKTTVSGKQGDAFRMNINNLNIPISRVGTIADVNIPPDGTLGRFGVGTFLFSGGFMMSGYTNGSLWAFAQASASLVENMTPGTPASGPNDPDAVIYVLDREDPPFSQSWIDWKTAVDKFGADFYDGDADGQYIPVDKNGNGEWDADEDHPDLLGDQTAWCVYTDGQPGAQRLRFAGVNPQGVEVRQTVFAFASKGALGNIMFIRYRLKNSGLVADRLDSVLFGVWADPDVGTDFENDLVGVDVPRNAGFTYNTDGVDPAYGVAQPCFMIDFFLGPRSYIAGETYIDNNGNGIYDDGTDTVLDTAYSYRGKLLGVKKYPGAKNLGVSSFVHYIQSDPERGDPNDEFEARNYMNGRLKLGEVFDPCASDAWGGVFGGVDCATLDNRFWYSGDPVANTGWLTTTGTDQRQMTNVGPITLNKDEEIEILVAYVVGQGTDRLSSIVKARSIDDGAQFIFDGNFRAPIPPPTINPIVESGNDFIDFIFPIHKQISFVDSTSAWIDKYHSTNVYTYKVNSTQDVVAGEQNSKLYKSYQKDYFVKNLYKENSETGGIELLYPEADDSLVYELYSDSLTSKIRLRISADPFTGGPLIKGKPYYFSFSSTAINYDALEKKGAGNYGDEGDYYLSTAGFVAEVENVPRIITVVLGEDMYSPPITTQPANKVAGSSLGDVGYDVVEQSKLTNNKYQVTFFKDSSATEYSMFWRLKNLTTGATLVDTSSSYRFGDEEFIADKVTDGFITKVENQTATLGTPSYTPTQNVWYDEFSTNSNTGVFYVGTDIPQGTGFINFRNKQSSYITADRLRKVELRFGSNGKAYRYINGYVGSSNISRLNAYSFAGAITPADTVSRGVIGNWNTSIDRPNGYIDVPFTAWVVDERYPNDHRQLAVAIVEKRNSTNFPGGKPDGIWDPGDSLNTSGEIIIILDADYDPNGQQIEYTGGEFNTPGGTVIVWSDLLRATTGLQSPPSDAIGFSETQRAKFLSPWFNAMYVVGLQKQVPSSTFSSGDILTTNITIYPYTSEDIYEFTLSPTTLSEDQRRLLFDKANVYPNPLYAFNVATSYNNGSPDEPFVTFSNLPEEVSIKIYSLSGQLLRTLGIEDKSSPTSPFLRWNLQNESGLRVASGMYFAIVTSPNYGEKVLKFAIIMPQKQIQKY